jgi:LuxR family maltose regulon positive regulatory protein
LDAAFATYSEALEWGTEPGGKLLPVAGFPLLKLGDVLRERNDLDSAVQNLDKGLELCAQLGQADVLAECYVTLARLRLAQGHPEEASDALEQADQIASDVRIDPWITSWADECRLAVWLSRGELEHAINWAEASGLNVNDPFSYHHDLHHINLARVLLARGTAHASKSDLDKAQGLLARLLIAAEKAGWIHEQIKILVLQALALDVVRDGEGALATLERALALAEPGGYVRIFIDEGTRMAALLRRAAERGIAPGHTNKLLLAVGEQAAGQAPAEQTDVSPLLEPLSEREIEILRLIAEGLTNRQIGEQLFISQGTVKAHTSNIYGKLGVRSRTQAVAQARTWNLL